MKQYKILVVDMRIISSNWSSLIWRKKVIEIVANDGRSAWTWSMLNI